MIGRIFGTLAALVGAVIVAVLVMFIFVAKHYRLPSSSMEATLHCAQPGSGCCAKDADRLIAFTFLGDGRGDIVAMKTPPLAEERCGASGIFIKRIIGLPGETVAEKRGSIYVNGKKLDEPYVEPDLRDFQSYAARKIASGHYFMLGDNRQASCDSRVWAFAQEEHRRQGLRRLVAGEPHSFPVTPCYHSARPSGRSPYEQDHRGTRARPAA